MLVSFRALAPLAAGLFLLAASQPSAQTVDFMVPLEESQVVPPSGSPGSGVALVSVDVSNGDINAVIFFSALSAPLMSASLRGPADPGATGGSVLGIFGPFTSSGAWSGGGTISATLVNELLNGRIYVELVSSTGPELRGQLCLTAEVGNRSAAPNPDSYTADPARFGTTFQATVDLTTTGHSMALLIAFDSEIDITLGGGQRLLCLGLGSPDELFTGAGLGPVAGPVAAFSWTVPNDITLCNEVFYSQALHFGNVVPFALSNAQDLRLGF